MISVYLCVLCASVVDDSLANTHRRDTENTEEARRISIRTLPSRQRSVEQLFCNLLNSDYCLLSPSFHDIAIEKWAAKSAVIKLNKTSETVRTTVSTLVFFPHVANTMKVGKTTIA